MKLKVKKMVCCTDSKCFNVMLTSIVLSICLDRVLFYHAFQVKSIHIYFDHLVFFKENVRYPEWTCRDPISMILGTRFSLIPGTR